MAKLKGTKVYQTLILNYYHNIYAFFGWNKLLLILLQIIKKKRQAIRSNCIDVPRQVIKGLLFYSSSWPGYFRNNNRKT